MPYAKRLVIYPGGNGDFSDHLVFGAALEYQAVDDVVANDDTDYTYTPAGSFADRFDVFTLAAYNQPRGTIIGINVRVRVRYASPPLSGDAQVDPVLWHQASSNLFSFSTVVATSSWQETAGTYPYRTTNPFTGLAWEWTDLDSIQFGYNTLTPNGAEVRYTQCLLEVYYVPPGWYNAPADLFSFLSDADASLLDYLTSTSVTEANTTTLTAFLRTAKAITLKVTPRTIDDFPDYSKSKLPIVHLWTDTALGAFEETVSTAVKCSTRFQVWTQNTDPLLAAEENRSICGAISSLMQQNSIIAGAHDWTGFYNNYGDPTTKCEAVRFVETEALGGVCEGLLTVEWEHNDA